MKAKEVLFKRLKNPKKKIKRLQKRKASTSRSNSSGIGGESLSDKASNNLKSNSTHSMTCKVNNLKSEVQMRNDQSVDPAIIEKNDYRILSNAAIDAARYLLKCGLPFFNASDNSEMFLHKGNFIETIKFIEDQNETVHNVMLRYSQEYSLMVDTSIPIDIVNCFAQEILEPIFKEIGDDVFALIVDEYIDISGKKQMAVILRYVTDGIVKERFVGLIYVWETSAVFLEFAIGCLLAEYGLSLKKVRGFSYDGTSNMRDEFNGLKDLIMKENSSAYYVHCFVHQLQLVVVAVAKKYHGVGILSDMIDVLKNVVFASCNQKNMVRESQKEKIHEAIGFNEIETQSGSNEEGSYYTILLHLADQFSCVVEVLEYVAEEGNNDFSQRQAKNILIYFASFDFVFYLHLMLHILGLTDLLSQALQRKEQDLLNTISLMKSTMEQLQKFKDDGFGLLLKKIIFFCVKHDIKMLNMEEEYVNPKNPTQKTNITYRQHYELYCFNKVVDMQILEFRDRFSDVTSELLTCMAALNPCNSFCDFDLSMLMRLAEFYPDDFDWFERNELKNELDIYTYIVKKDERFANLNGINDLAIMAVKTGRHITFTLVYRLLKLALVLPVATTTVERCFSAKEIVKSYLSNQICDDFVNACVVPVVEKELLANVTNEDVIDRSCKIETPGEQL